MTSVAINSCVTISLTCPISFNRCNLQLDCGSVYMWGIGLGLGGRREENNIIYGIINMLNDQQIKMYPQNMFSDSPG